MDDISVRPAAVATLPARLYCDPDAFARERQAIFRKTWQLIGREADLAEPGDFLADEIGGAPVLVARGADGALHAHHNVCRHRAGPLVDSPRGNCGKELVCRYHGWRFALDGRLRSAVDFGPAEGFDPRELSLYPVRVETWRGLVFVNLDPESRPLADTCAPLDDIWEAHGVRLPPSFAMGKSWELGCNWKVYAENFMESYHLPLVHPGLCEEIDTRQYRVYVDRGAVVQEAAALPNPNAANLGLWIWLWPGLGVSIFSGGLMIERMTPLALDRTRLDYFYFHDHGSGVDFDNVFAVSTRTTSEDIRICEQVHRRLASGVYERGVLSPTQEAGIAWFQARVREAHAGKM